MDSYLSDLMTYIGRDIAEVVIYLNPALMIPSAVLLSVLAYAAGRGKSRAGARIQSVVKLLFGLGYGIVLFLITLLSREPGSRTGVDLIPFATVFHSAQGDAYVIENILLFIPFGILAGWFFPAAGNGRKAVCAGFFLSLLIEVIQYLTGCGYAQTDDLITNTIGTGLGYWGYVLLKRMMSDRRRKTGCKD